MTRLRVVAAGPLVSIQDVGRSGMLRFGAPASGPMDRLAFAVVNQVVGNAPRTAGVEVSTGGLVVECDGADVTVAVAGGAFRVDVDGAPLTGWSVRTLATGERLTIRSGATGSWAYLGVAGRLRSPTWSGSASTHSTSGLGGGLLSAGDVLEIEAPRVLSDRDGPIDVPDRCRPIESARVVLGPQDHRFERAAVESFTSATFRLTSAFDRMGVRLDGPPLALADALAIPSEAIVRGSVQVAGDGVATVLLADHQTTGGYPKIATVIGADVDRVAQLRPGDPIRFRPVSPARAVEAARSHAAEVEEVLAAVVRPGRTLEHRLWLENLVHGVVSPADVDVILDSGSS